MRVRRVAGRALAGGILPYAEVKTAINELDQQPDRGDELVGVRQGRGLSRRDVRAFVGRRIRLFVRIAESQEAVREQIRRLPTERRVDVRLTGLIEELREKGNLDLPL